ncbi:uncharacterized protein [Amphiura filiformis]|uniref:uncharacterized protein n=1 Tax=Amphiura filiformis TaxID=82378 RepID=UPI003B21A61C
MMNVETECIKPADDDVSSTDSQEETQNDEKVTAGKTYKEEDTTVFGFKEEDCLAKPKRNNIRRISDELKVTASGALGTGKDGIKKAASGLSSGLKTVTNRISLPKSPKAFRRRSWHAYDELEDEEHIIPEKESASDDDRRETKKVKDKSDPKEKTKKDKKEKNKIKKNGKGKIDWCNRDGLIDDIDDNKCEKEDEEKLDLKTDEPIIFEPLEAADLMSKVTISVEEAD